MSGGVAGWVGWFKPFMVGFVEFWWLQGVGMSLSDLLLGSLALVIVELIVTVVVRVMLGVVVGSGGGVWGSGEQRRFQRGLLEGLLQVLM